MTETLQQKIDHILYDLTYTPMEDSSGWTTEQVNKTIQELREDIMNLRVWHELESNGKPAQAVNIEDVLALIGEKHD